MSSHIQLGAAGALRPYQLKGVGDDGISWRRSPANPFTSQVNTTNPYGEVGIWNEWVQEDWQAGVGRVDPEAGGFLYAEAETRVPKEIILPPMMQVADLRTLTATKSDCRYMPSSTNTVAGTITIGSGGVVRAAMAIQTPNPYTAGGVLHAMIYARIPVGVIALLSIFTNSAGSPGTLLGTGAVTGVNPDRNFYWYGRAPSVALSADTQYWVVIEPFSASDTIEVAYGTSGYDTDVKTYNGSSWSAQTGKYLFFATDVFRMTDGDGADGHFIRFNSNLYHVADEGLYKFASGTNSWSSVGTITGTGNVTSVAVFGPTLYFARSTSVYTTMNTSESFTAASDSASLFIEYAGLLYRAYQNDLYYSADGSTWSSAFQVGGDDVVIRGMAGMGDSLYLATDKALYRFAPGDVVEETTRFGAEDTSNGVGMMEYQGRLYIPAHGRLLRFDPSGQLQDIWVSRDDDLPATRLGRIVSLARMNNWLVAYAIPTSASYLPSLWAWQEEGWHFLCNGPTGAAVAATEIYSTYYDRSSQRLWISWSGIVPLYAGIEDYTLNPYNSTTYLYQPYGWLEQDRFYGGFFSLNKVFYSVRIFGDNLSANVCTKIYWQDEGSTAWELLGTADSDGEELSWPIATRPLGKWLKLGILLQTNDSDETPRVRSIVTKTLPITNDRFRDTLTLRLEPNVQGPAGDPDTTYTVAQQVAHINSLIGDDANFLHIYQDPFGSQYEVTIVDYSWSMPTYAWENGAKVIKAVEVTLIVEQVLEGTYA